ncbi:MAG: homocitrate synthase/isopropylmalate synthase family protein [Bacillota bacterium]
MKNPHTVEPFQPEIFGRKHEVKLGKKSGKANIQWKLKELGLELHEDQPGESFGFSKNRGCKAAESL